MDPKKTGEFIALLRKEQEMTQKDLAEKLNVSDKAILAGKPVRAFRKRGF
jgi:transcriptional regulator with XRE-family HTH domain